MCGAVTISYGIYSMYSTNVTESNRATLTGHISFTVMQHNRTYQSCVQLQYVRALSNLSLCLDYVRD